MFAAIIITRSAAALNRVAPINRFFNTGMRLYSAQSKFRIHDLLGVCVCVCVCLVMGGGDRRVSGEKHKQRAESPLAAEVLFPQHESLSVCYCI